MSNMYDYYYTSADAMVFIAPSYQLTVNSSKKVFLDLAVGIGYRHSISSMPIYELGNTNPAFYTRGNSLVTGTLELSFKSNQYLQNVIKHVNGITTNDTQTLTTLQQKINNGGANTLTVKELETYQILSERNSNNTTGDGSLSNLNELVNIEIWLNNTNSSKSGNNFITTIYGVKFIEFVQAISSQAEGVVTDQFKFYGKNITTSK